MILVLFLGFNMQNNRSLLEVDVTFDYNNTRTFPTFLLIAINRRIVCWLVDYCTPLIISFRAY